MRAGNPGSGNEADEDTQNIHALALDSDANTNTYTNNADGNEEREVGFSEF